MNASSLSSALPPIDPTVSMGGGAVAPDAKGADVKSANGRMPFDDVLRQLAAMLGEGAGDAPAFASAGAHGAAQAAPVAAAMPSELAHDQSPTDAVAPVVVPVPFLTTAPMPTPLVAIPHQAFDGGNPQPVAVQAHVEAPIDEPSDGMALPVPGLATGEGCEAADTPIRLTLGHTPGDTCSAPEMPSVAIGDADPVPVPAPRPEPETDTDAMARVIDLVKKAVPVHDHQPGPATTGPARSTSDNAAAPREASTDHAIGALAMQLATRADDMRQQGDGWRDETNQRGQGRAAHAAATGDDRAGAAAKVADAPVHVASAASPASPPAPAQAHSAPAAATSDAPAEPATTHTSAAPAFAAHVALESPTSGPRLMTAPGFTAHLDAAPALIDRELPGQIVQAIRMQFAQGGGDAVVRLQPHFLGEVVVSIRVEQGLVTAALQSDTPAVRQWIETHEGSLRTALADQGLQLERLVVTGETKTRDGEDTARRQPGDPESPEQRQRRSRRRKNDPDDQGTFEVFA